MPKKILNTVFFLTIFVFLTSSVSFSANVSEIGLVDFQKILQESSAGKMAQKEINRKGKELEENLNEMRDKIEELKDNLEREALVMSKEKREQRQREIRIKINDFKQQKEKYKEDFQTLENQIIKKMQKEVFHIARQIGESEGYLLIMEASTAGVLYNRDTIEITDKVIKKYNEMLAQQTGSDKSGE